jgi:hypothetical protein
LNHPFLKKCRKMPVAWSGSASVQYAGAMWRQRELPGRWCWPGAGKEPERRDSDISKAHLSGKIEKDETEWKPIIVDGDLRTRCGISSVVCPAVITVAGYEGGLPLVRKEYAAICIQCG